MKKFITLLFAGTLLFSCGETQEKPSTDDEVLTEEVVNPVQELDGYTHFGTQAIDHEAAISIDSFASAFSNGETANYTINTNLSSICAKAGCFVIVTLPDSTDVRVMFKDHFTIPTDTKIGTEAIFTGEAMMDTTSVADLQHYIMDEMEDENIEAEKKAELQAKHDAITEPTLELIFIATGILVKN
jgi:hypothetical protein